MANCFHGFRHVCFLLYFSYILCLRLFVTDAKLFIGRRFIDPSVQNDMKLWPFKVIPGPGDKPMVVVSYKGEEKQFSAEEISSTILKKKKKTA